MLDRLKIGSGLARRIWRCAADGIIPRTKQMTVTESLFVAVLGGLFTVTLQYVRGLLMRPRLKVTWDRHNGGCVVPTPLFRKDHYPTEKVGEGRFLRLRIDNDGCTTARNVCVSIISIKQRIPGSGEGKFD